MHWGELSLCVSLMISLDRKFNAVEQGCCGRKPKINIIVKAVTTMRVLRKHASTGSTEVPR